MKDYCNENPFDVYETSYCEECDSYYECTSNTGNLDLQMARMLKCAKMRKLLKELNGKV